MTKVGEHITLDIIGTKKEYDSSFFESLVNKKLIYYKSPIGKGLIGKNKNDLVKITTPAGIKNFEIKNVKYI